MGRAIGPPASDGGFVAGQGIREGVVGETLSPGQDGAAGLRRAIERYGSPVERSYVHRAGKSFFANLAEQKRLCEVVILLRRRNGLYLVHTKEFYPTGVYRMLSGGVEPGEDLMAALKREALEETGLEVRVERFLGILHHRFLWRGQSLPFVSYLFLVVEEGGVLACSDPREAITGFREAGLREVADLADRLESLPADWADWGRFRATAHRLVGELPLDNGR